MKTSFNFLLVGCLFGVVGTCTASALNPTPAEMQASKQAMRDTAAWLLEEHVAPGDSPLASLPNGARRTITLTEQALGQVQELSEYADLNNHAACRTLEFLALYAQYGADSTVLLEDGHTERHHVRVGVRRFVDLILNKLRSNDSSKFDYVAIANATNASGYEVLSNVACGRALLASSAVMGEPDWKTRAVEIAQFLLRLQNPEPYYTGRVDLSSRSTRDGIFNGVYRKSINGVLEDVLYANMKTWNLAAAPFLEDIYEATNVIGYHYGAIKIIRGLKDGALNNYDYYAIGGLPQSDLLDKVFHNGDCVAPVPYSDGQWHHFGDPCPRGQGNRYASTGTDGVEYGLAALHEYGYNDVELAQAYLDLLDMPVRDRDGNEIFSYDMGLSLTGFFRMCRVVPDPACVPYHLGAYYDTVGLGLLALFKLDLASPENANDVFTNLLRGPLEIGTAADPGPVGDPSMIAQWTKLDPEQSGEYPRTRPQGILPVVVNATAILNIVARCQMDSEGVGCTN